MLSTAEKYLKDHNNPVLKLEQFGKKLFVSPLSPEESQKKDNCLLQIEQILRHDRVDIRRARCKADWKLEEQVAVVTKLAGSSIAHFGYQNKNGKFLRPEEALFLVETNKLELFYNKRPLSVEEAYKIVIQGNFKKYFIYKKMALQGYRLKPGFKEGDHDDEPPRKIAKVEEASSNYVDLGEIFKKLQGTGPKKYETKGGSSNIDYTVSPPCNSNERNQEFNLIIERERHLDTVNVSDNCADIYALDCDEGVAFYKLLDFDVPTL